MKLAGEDQLTRFERALNSFTVSSKPSMVATPMPTLAPADLICFERALMAAPTC